MAKWIDRIEATETLWEMDQLIEKIAYDDTITNEEYALLYELALNKMR